MADIYNTLSSPTDNKYFNDDKITEHLINLSIIGATSFYPIVMAMAVDYSEEEIRKTVRQIEVLALRNFVVAGLTANKYEVEFAKLAEKISKNNPSIDDILKELIDLTDDDEKFKRNLIGLEVKTVKTAKYILREIEDHNSSGEKRMSKNNKLINLEHIMPKKNTIWKVDPEIHKKYLYRLGNQTLLLDEYNKSIQHKEFDTKKTVYTKSKVEMTKDLCNYEKWDVNAINAREGELNKSILEIWALNE